jgi:hypothetical protein
MTIEYGNSERRPTMRVDIGVSSMSKENLHDISMPRFCGLVQSSPMGGLYIVINKSPALDQEPDNF